MLIARRVAAVLFIAAVTGTRNGVVSVATMMERGDVTTFRGDPVTLLGTPVRVGERARGFSVMGTDMAPLSLTWRPGAVRVLCSVPSLDTPVCDQQTRRFNEEIANLPGAEVLTVSVDLPFALARWCGSAGITAVTTASDYRDHSFGLAYGVAIKELGLLARAVFVVDPDDIVVHAEYVSAVEAEPDYAAAIAAAKGASRQGAGLAGPGSE